MFDFNEDLLQFIWKYKLLKPGKYITESGREIKIINYGELNSDSGPDFFNAKIKIDNITLAGNVEIHVKASDWKKHHHHKDNAYSNVILHVVYDNDEKKSSSAGCETLVIKKHFDSEIIKKYKGLVNSERKLPCAKHIGKISEIKINTWLERLLVERLESKTLYIENIFTQTGNDYAAAFYTLFLRNLGFKVNAEPFETLARHLPLSVLLKHSNNLFQLEALIFGTAGLLEKTYSEKYIQQLQNEFEFLKTKYKLHPLKQGVWKFMRMRPANFPSMRMWQLAKIIHHEREFFSNPSDFNSVKKLETAISHNPEGYWQCHYSLGGAKQDETGRLGRTSVENIMINTMAPFLFFYHKRNGKENFNPMNLLEELESETNAKTRIFTGCGLKTENAGQSQALIQLYDNYCKKKNCLQCAIAAQLLLNP